MDNKFDTRVQRLKCDVLREVAKQAWNGTLEQNIGQIKDTILPSKQPTTHCCTLREQAIADRRIKMAMGGDKSNPNVIEVIDVACDKCPTGSYVVTDVCRGCLAHRCQDACRKGAITIEGKDYHAKIDPEKCVQCGACAKACPYTAIVKKSRPCQNACKIKAMGIAEDGTAKIDDSKCISCGACAYSCPWGAVVDKSYILDVINMIKGSDNGKNYEVYAVVAPAFASQFTYAKQGQVMSGIKKLGFNKVVEAALGGDVAAKAESAELAEKGFLTSSCCPAFVKYIENEFPDLVPFVSHNASPMVITGQYIKERVDANAKVVFVGPCTAKKMEMQRERSKPFVDAVITFEELQALFESRDIDISTLEESEIDDASYFGRIFGKSGGLTEAVVQGLKEQGITDFNLNAVVCNGIEECKMELLKKSKNASPYNFIEGMCCVGGCVNGGGEMVHGDKNRIILDKFAKEARKQTVEQALSEMK